MSHHPQGSAVAWVAYEASSGTPTITGSHNVSSLTDDGVGLATVNFRTALASSSYAVSGSARYPTSGITGKLYATVQLRRQATAARTVSACKIQATAQFAPMSGVLWGNVDVYEISALFYGGQ